MTGQFEQVAKVVVERLAELLSAHILVLDSRGIIVVSSNPHSFGYLFDQTNLDPNVNCLRVPIEIDGQLGEAIAIPSADCEIVSPRLVQRLVDLIIGQATVMVQLPNSHELKHKFIHDLLRGSPLNEADIVREGQILGMDLTRPRAVILIDASDYILATTGLEELGLAATQIWRRAQWVISSIVSFFQLPNDTICAYIGDGEIAVLKASSSKDLADWTTCEDEGNGNVSWANLTALKRAATALLMRLQSDTQACISIGIGRYHPTLQGLAQSYQDARAALSLGRRFHGQNQVHCLDELGIAAFVGVSDERTKIDLARHLLSPLDQEPELLETLDVFFFKNCSSSSTASRLAIHRNTLSYRLEKIASLTGLDPRQFDDAMQIRLALFLRSLHTDLSLCKCPTTKRRDSSFVRQMSDVLIS